MNFTVYTFEDHNLGDSLVFLHLLRALAKRYKEHQFVHFCGAHHHANLKEVVADVPTIHLFPFEGTMWQNHREEATCVWKNFDHFWEHAHDRWRWSEFMLNHHHWTAMRMGGFGSPFKSPHDLLFDYPALQENIPGDSWEFLIVDAEPCSGQFRPMAQHGSGHLNQFIALLKNAGHDVITTSQCKKDGLTVSQIGALSLKCTHVVGVMSGPAWACISTHRHHLHCTEGRRTIFLLDNGERLNLPGVEQCSNMDELMCLAVGAGWI